MLLVNEALLALLSEIGRINRLFDLDYLEWSESRFLIKLVLDGIVNKSTEIEYGVLCYDRNPSLDAFNIWKSAILWSGLLSKSEKLEKLILNEY